jgi:hypothetical protein
MTDGTVGFRIIFTADLILVDVLMALNASEPDIPETPLVGFAVTVDTGYCLVCPFQAETGKVMLINGIEDLVKTFRVVAFGAIFNNAIPGELFVMIIGVTIGAGDSDIPETPFICLPVAFCTLCGKMSSVEQKFSPVVLINREGCLIIAFCAVTIWAILYLSIQHKLPVMVILVAIGALVVLYWFIDIRGMAGCTGHTVVLIFQFEIRLGMIKAAVRFQDVKRDLGVALFALLSELILVNILMAVRTISEKDTGKYLEFCPVFGRSCMTFFTRYFLVFSGQWKTGGRVFEFWGRFESVKTMAIRTGCREGFLMIIGVTGETFSCQSEVGKFLGLYSVVNDEFRLVAIFAGFLWMGSGQGETREAMIEFFLIKTKDLKGNSVMVAVAFAAFLSPNIRWGMVPFILVNPCFHLCVAGKAFGIGDLIA